MTESKEERETQQQEAEKDTIWAATVAFWEQPEQQELIKAVYPEGPVVWPLYPDPRIIPLWAMMKDDACRLAGLPFGVPILLQLEETEDGKKPWLLGSIIGNKGDGTPVIQSKRFEHIEETVYAGKVLLLMMLQMKQEGNRD